MARKKSLTHEEKIIKALNTLPDVLVDNKHRIKIKFINDQARSNETRFEHISLARHQLTPNDIKRIQKEISNSELRIDDARTKTYSIYIKRNNFNDEYIKLSITLNFKIYNVAKVKTVYITKIIK